MSDSYLKRYADAGLYMMQGRLSAPEDGRFQSFPRQHWREEIVSAARIGLRGIEWIYDVYGEGANPLETAMGREELKALLASNDMHVASICADHFMDAPLLRCTEQQREERLGHLAWLIGVCPDLDIQRIVLPFVDASSIRSAAEQACVVASLRRVLPQAEQRGVELHLETDLEPIAFRDLLQDINHPLVKVNYDSGNSAALGYVPEQEFDAYGQWVGSFHIKDRRLRGTTVPLGQGDTDFCGLRRALLDINYRGDFVLQVARGAQGDEEVWMQHTATFAANWLRGKPLI